MSVPPVSLGAVSHSLTPSCQFLFLFLSFAQLVLASVNPVLPVLLAIIVLVAVLLLFVFPASPARKVLWPVQLD